LLAKNEKQDHHKFGYQTLTILTKNKKKSV